MPSAFSWPVFVPSALSGSGAGELGVRLYGIGAMIGLIALALLAGYLYLVGKTTLFIA